MKTIFCILAAGVSWLTLASPSARAQSANPLKVYTAVEIEFETELGKTYTIQGAVNLTNWTDIGNSTLGNGRGVHRIYSTKSGDSINFAAYRLLIENGPTNGYAPWSISGVRLRMDDASATNEVEYTSNDHGRDIYKSGDDAFTYDYSRLSDNESRVDRNYGPDRHEVLSYSYSSPGIGTWVREEYTQGHLDRRDLGVFRYISAGTNSYSGNTNYPPIVTTTQPPMPPTVLTGLTYYVHSGAIPDRLVFSSATSGTAYPGTSVVSSGRRNDESNPTGNIFTYTYSVDHSNSAHLTLNFGYYGLGGDKNEYELQFTDGPSGLFSRRIYRLGSLFATDSGAFSPYAVLPSTNSGGTNGTVTLENPPTNPKGYTYNVNVDGIVERLVFQSDTAGIDYDDSAPTDYTYTYASTGTRKFSLVVQFKADRWDEYALSFSSGGQGSYVRRRFRNNALIKTSSGTFTVSNNGK